MNTLLTVQTQEAKKVSLKFKIAESDSEVMQCQSLISEVYYQKLGITFSESGYDIEGKIELYPHVYLMGLVDSELVATMGLYLHSTNPERYGKVTAEDIDKLVAEAGFSNAYSGKYIRELSKFVVKPEWRNKGIGKLLMGVSHSKDFIHYKQEQPNLIVACANQSIYSYFADSLGINTRLIKPVPFHKIHEFYRSGDEPMESRLIIPELDIPSEWYETKLPKEYEVI